MTAEYATILVKGECLHGLHTTTPSASTTVGGHHAQWTIEWVHPRRRRTSLEPLPLLLGRAAEGGGLLEGSELSRHHAQLVQQGPIFVIEDLRSRNGTHVEGMKVDRGPLGDGSVIRIGEWVGVIVAWREDPKEWLFGDLGVGIWGGPHLAQQMEIARRAAPSELTLVVEGETGTGKERAACAIHEWSGRQGPFVAINCAALPASLAEAELFGYRRGAFTGADRASPGHFRSADRGTLLLDEFIELPLEMQAKLLRTIEAREVTPLGESRPVSIDVRVIVAAQKPLTEAVATQRLRPDLFARLDGLTVRLPPLRQRREDIAGLFTHFLDGISGGRPPQVHARLIERLCLYAWPFNVRELNQLARKLLLLHGHEPVLQCSHLPERFSDEKERKQITLPAGESENRDEQDLRALLEALPEVENNLALASAAVGISRQRAYRLINRAPGVSLQKLRKGKPG